MEVPTIISMALLVVAVAVGCVSLACFFRVFVAMRQNGDETLAALCLIGLLMFGIGGLVAFVHGVVKARELDVDRAMMLWGAGLALLLMLWGASFAIPT